MVRRTHISHSTIYSHFHITTNPSEPTCHGACFASICTNTWHISWHFSQCQLLCLLNAGTISKIHRATDLSLSLKCIYRAIIEPCLNWPWPNNRTPHLKKKTNFGSDVYTFICQVPTYMCTYQHRTYAYTHSHTYNMWSCKNMVTRCLLILLFVWIFFR